MRVSKSGNSDEFLTLTVETEDDLWYLSNIIEPGDQIRATVMRRVEQQSDMTRSKETGRKPMTVTVSVESCTFQDFSGVLKVLGTVSSGPEDAVGSYQSININPGTSIDIWKPAWSQEQRNLLKEAEEQTFSEGTYFISCDEEEAQLFQLRTYGIRPLGKVESGRTGKYYDSADTTAKYFENVRELVRKYVPKGSVLIVLGSQFTAESLTKQLSSDNSMMLKIIFFPTSRTDEGAVYEFLRSEKGAETVKNARIARDASLLNAFLIHLRSDGKATYGYEQVKGSVELGAVETLLITDREFRTSRGRELLELASNSGATVHVISTSNDGGKMLTGFGGVAAILRYVTGAT